MRCISQARLHVSIDRSIQVDPSTVSNNPGDERNNSFGLPCIERRHTIHQSVPKSLSDFTSVAEHLDRKGAVHRSVAQRRFELLGVDADGLGRCGLVLFRCMHVTARATPRVRHRGEVRQEECSTGISLVVEGRRGIGNDIADWVENSPSSALVWKIEVHNWRLQELQAMCLL